jgi:hypothetical protein
LGQSDFQRDHIVKLSVQFSKNYKACKGKHGSLTEEKKKGFTKTVPEEAQTLGFVIKDSKSSVLNTLSELKEAMGQRPRGTQEEDV